MNRTVDPGAGGCGSGALRDRGGRFGPADEQVVKLLPEKVPGDPGGQQDGHARGQGPVLPFLQKMSAVYPVCRDRPVSAAEGPQHRPDQLKAASPICRGRSHLRRDDITDRSERFLAAEFLREKTVPASSAKSCPTA